MVEMLDCPDCQHYLDTMQGWAQYNKDKQLQVYVQNMRDLEKMHAVKTLEGES